MKTNRNLSRGGDGSFAEHGGVFLHVRLGRFVKFVMIAYLMLVPLDPTHAQVAYDGNGVAAANLSNVDSVSIPGFQTPAGTDRLLLVAVDYAVPATAVASVTYGGEHLSLAATGVRDEVIFVDIWYLALGNGDPVVADIEVNLNGLTNNFRAGAASFQNVSQVTPIGETQSKSGLFQTSSSLSVTTSINNAVVDAIAASGFVGVVLTSGALQVDLFLESTVNFLAGSFQLASGNSTQMDWVLADSTNIIHAAVEINCSCNDPMEKAGTSGDDELIGGEGDDVLIAFGGDDLLDGAGGNDELYGGAGNDELFGGAGNDLLDPGTGDNCLDGGPGHDVFELKLSSEELAQIYHTNTSIITAGHTAVMSMARNIGSLNVPSVPLSAALSGSTTKIKSSLFPTCVPFAPPAPNSDTNSIYNVEEFIGTETNDTMIGDTGNDIFRGSGGDDELIGKDGDDTLEGGPGDDMLNGGEGSDLLNGGNGSDTAYYDGFRSDYELGQSGTEFSITHKASGDMDLLTGIELIQFEDAAVNLIPVPVPAASKSALALIILLQAYFGWLLLHPGRSYPDPKPSVVD